MLTNEFVGFSKILHVKLVVSYVTYNKLCSLFDFLWSSQKKLGSLISQVELLGGGFLLYSQVSSY